MTRDNALAAIGKEISTGTKALEDGNSGMARVCARRAAGVAISFWLETHPHAEWGSDAMQRLRAVQGEHSIPEHVREAARRLSTKIGKQFTSQFATDPLEDGGIIIQYFMDQL